MKTLSLLKTMIVIAVIGLFMTVNIAYATESKLDNVAISTGKMVVGPLANLSPQRIVDKTKADGFSGFFKAAIAYAPIVIVKFLEEGANVVTLDQSHQPVTSAGEWMVGAN